MGIYTFGKTPFNSHYPKINGIQWDYFNGKQWETLPRALGKVTTESDSEKILNAKLRFE